MERPHPRQVPRLNRTAGRTWLKIDADGQSQIVATDRHRLTHELGVQTRDLRILDPKFSTNYPSAILCRGNAIVLNILHIKAIVTTEYVLVTNPDSEDYELQAFVQRLEMRLQQKDFPDAASFPVLINVLVNKKTGKLKENETKNGQIIRHSRQDKHQLENQSENSGRPAGSYHPVEQRNPCAALPFELKTLEICTFLDAQATQLEGTAFPAVDALTLRITTKNLQRVRAVKGQIVQKKTRVETVKEILNKFLDDDDDMRDMHLTAKQQHRQSSHSTDDSVLDRLQKESAKSHRRSWSSSSSSDSSDVDYAVQEVEMLLEAYFMQLDNIFNRLLTMSEYIDDTEDFINFVQDKHRNQLLKLELIITAGTFALTIVAVVSGIFGMNLNNSFSEESEKPFFMVTCTALVVATLVLLIILWFCRRKGLMGI